MLGRSVFTAISQLTRISYGRTWLHLPRSRTWLLCAIGKRHWNRESDLPIWLSSKVDLDGLGTRGSRVLDESLGNTLVKRGTSGKNDGFVKLSSEKDRAGQSAAAVFVSWVYDGVCPW
jgi:hypothetical protein